MSDASTASAAESIETRLRVALDPTHLQVINDSRLHAGHQGDDGSGESHFTVIVESAAFEGKNRVQRQRMVNKALAELLSSRIHALAIRARAPGEA